MLEKFQFKTVPFQNKTKQNKQNKNKNKINQL